MSDVDAKPGGGNFLISTLAIIGCFLIFAVIIYIARIPERSAKNTPANLTPEERLEKNILTPEERKDRLIELRNKERAAAASYGWVDRSGGVVRLPVDRAVELTVRELQQKRASR